MVFTDEKIRAIFHLKSALSKTIFYSKLTQKLWTVGRYAKNTNTQKQNVDMNRDFPDLSQIYFDDESALFDQSKINKTMATNSENNQHEYFQAQESRVLKRLFEKENFDYKLVLQICHENGRKWPKNAVKMQWKCRKNAVKIP